MEKGGGREEGGRRREGGRREGGREEGEDDKTNERGGEVKYFLLCLRRHHHRPRL